MSQPIPIPNSEIRFYEDVPVSPASGMQVAFNSTEQQATFWERYRKITFNSTTYVHGGSLGSGHVTITADPVAALRWDHLSFLNPSYESKRFYCRITSVEQVTGNAVKVNFEVDAWQTWMFEARWRPCTIERQHILGSQWAQAVANPYSSNVASLRSAEPVNLTASMELFNADPDGGRIRSDGSHQGWELTGLDDRNSDNYTPATSDVTPSGVEGYSKAIVKSGSTLGNAIMYFPGSTSYYQVSYGSSDSSAAPIMGYLLMLLNGITGAQLGEINTYLAGLDEYHPARQVTNRLLISEASAPGSFKSPSVRRIAIPMWSIYPGSADSVMSTIFNIVAGSGNATSLLGVWMVPPEVVESEFNFASGQKANDLIFEGAANAKVDSVYLREYTVPVPPLDESLTNPKLRFAPFRHVRLTAPDQTFKEYAVEDFDGGVPRFRLYASAVDVPEMILVPVGYRGKTMAWEERLSYDKFPQIAVKSNGYNEYIYQKSREIALSESRFSKAARDQVQDDARGNNGWLGRALNWGFDMVGDLAVKGMSVVAGATTALGTGNLTKGYETGMSMAADPYEEVKAAEQFAAGKGDAIHELFGEHKNWTIGEGTFIPGNRNGLLSQQLGQQHFRVEVVTYRPEVYADVERYLNSYGYADGSFDVPNVVRWVWGTGEKPHFANVNGIYSTYVKTLDAKVYGVHDTAAQAIKQMFDSGVRFQDGSI